MTTPEHTLVGIHCSLALGLHRRFGWTAVAMAAVASNAPDWDGLPMLIDMQRFEAGHRVWAHNFLAIAFSSVLLAWTQTRYHWIERVQRRVYYAASIEGAPTTPATSANTSAFTYGLIAFSAQVLHLLCDMVVSGGAGLSDWLIRPWWPLSQTGYVLPLIPWGDVGPTVILMAGVIAAAKWPVRVRAISALTLATLCVYLAARGWARGVLSF